MARHVPAGPMPKNVAIATILWFVWWMLVPLSCSTTQDPYGATNITFNGFLWVWLLGIFGIPFGMLYWGWSSGHEQVTDTIMKNVASRLGYQEEVASYAIRYRGGHPTLRTGRGKLSIRPLGFVIGVKRTAYASRYAWVHSVTLVNDTTIDLKATVWNLHTKKEEERVIWIQSDEASAIHEEIEKRISNHK